MAATPEQRIWRNRLKPALDNIRGLVYERVELRTGASGMPDVAYSYGPRGCGWIENKAVAEPDSNGFIDLAGWRRDQRDWARRWTSAGARVLLYAGDPLESWVLVVTPDLCDEHRLHISRFNPVRGDRARLAAILKHC